jgi:hypothetical protein
MAAPISAAAVTALAEEVIDWRFKGLPSAWWGRTAAEVCADTPDLFEAGAVGPVCVLRADALTHNLTAMGAGAVTVASSCHHTARRTWPRNCSPGNSKRAPAESPQRH